MIYLNDFHVGKCDREKMYNNTGKNYFNMLLL